MSGTITSHRGRPARLSREIIFDAVARRADPEWTMAAIAADLGVTPHALYYYFPNKQTLLKAFGKSVMAELQLPECVGGQWSVWLRAVVTTFYDLAVRHPALAQPDGPVLLEHQASVELLEELLGTLVQCGFDVEDAANALALVMGTLRTSIRDSVTSTDEDRRGLLAGHESDVSMPNVAELSRRSPSLDPREQFETVLDWALAGIQASVRLRR